MDGVYDSKWAILDDLATANLLFTVAMWVVIAAIICWIGRKPKTAVDDDEREC